MKSLNLSRLVLAAVATVALVALLAPVTAEAQGYSFYPLTPCRLYDSRTGNPSAGGLGGGAITTTITGNDQYRQLTARGLCGIPAEAQAMAVNHTIITPTAPYGGVARMCPQPLVAPQTICRAFVNYGPTETIGNAGIMPLGPAAPDFQLQGLGYDLTIPGYLGAFTYHWTIDVTGYFQ